MRKAHYRLFNCSNSAEGVNINVVSLEKLPPAV